MQKHGEDMLPVAYFSKALRKAEKKYPAIQQELMAIVKDIAAFRQILYGRHFIILSDSKPLKHYKKSTSPMDIITRWLLSLREYSFTFKPGVKIRRSLRVEKPSVKLMTTFIVMVVKTKFIAAKYH